MNKQIVITGGFGFIGSNLVRLLNSKGITPYIIDKTDAIGRKWRNMVGLSFNLVKAIPCIVDSDWRVIHLGADVDTTAPMTAALWENNVDYSLNLWRETMDREGRFIYASSASIYGAEEVDFRERVEGMKPLNAYAFTKWQLDSAFKDKPNVYGLRFFNCYGSGEEHKAGMRSLVQRAVSGDFVKDGVFEIFKTGRPDIKDGDQARDFIHVEDVCSVIWHFIETEDTKGGLFNVGSGVATSFNQIAEVLGVQPKYIDMPIIVKDQYQFYTKADLTKLRAHGYDKLFMSVAEGIAKMKGI